MLNQMFELHVYILVYLLRYPPLLFCSSGSGSTSTVRFKAMRLKPLSPLMPPQLYILCMAWIVVIVFLLWCCAFDFQLLFIRRLGVDIGWKNSHDVSRQLSLCS